jgi:hypothetical protein
VGRVAFKRGVIPSKGDHVFAPPYASRLSTFRAPGWGTPGILLVVGGTQLRGSWYLSAIVRLQGFSSCSPAASPRRRSPKTVTTSPWVGRSKPGYDLGPALSFKDVHHPGWGGGQASFKGEGAHWPCERGGLRQRGAGRRRASSASACWARQLDSRCPLPPQGRLSRRAHGRTAQDVARC